MKRILKTAAALIALATPALADPAEGVWQTEVDDGKFAYITMAPCGGAYCGTISRTFENGGTEYQSENIGRQIVIDMVAAGDGSYTGQVWRPSNDKVYVGKMSVSGDSLTLKGCVAGGLICAAQGWARVQ
ncbi:MAG: hypothetical protein ACJAXK_001307 [Yoonia sp.]|jgi:uncharacterized protein (DUF2147 family)